MLSIRSDVTAELMQLDVVGHLSLRELLLSIDQFSIKARSSKPRALMLRLRPQTVLDQATLAILGQHIAEQLHWLDKIACVGLRPCETCTMERIAGHYGVRLRVFETEEPAAQWLAAERPKVSR